MAEMAGGALLGLAVTELMDAVKKVKGGVKDFKPQLMELERTLQMLHPMILEMEKMNTLMNNNASWDQREVVKRLQSILEDGKKLVSKCHAVARGVNFFKKPYYQKKLVELDNKLIRFNIKFMQPNTFLEVQKLRLEQKSCFNRLPDQISESLRSSITSVDGVTPSSGTTVHGGPVHHSGGHDLNLSYPRTVVPPPIPRSLVPIPVAPNRAPNITLFGFILYVVIILKVTAIAVIMYKAMTAIMCMAEESESEMCLMIKDVGMLESTIEQLEDTMTSLDHVLEEIEANSMGMMDNEEEADGGEAAKSLGSLLDEGEKLVLESYNIGWWNFVKKWQYQKKMVELDNKLLRFHSLYLQARLEKNSDKTSDNHVYLQARLEKISDKTSDNHDSEMKDNESFAPQHSVKHNTPSSMRKGVLEVELHDDKIKQKAMKAVSGIQGLDSVAVDMKENKMTVAGDMDPLTVVGKLRRLCHANILSVGPAKEKEKKKEESKKEDKKTEPVQGDEKVDDFMVMKAHDFIVAKADDFIDKFNQQLQLQKIVLKVELPDDKIKQKAIKAVSRIQGLDSVAVDRKEHKMTVVGCIDPLTVVGKLRELCHADILSVGPVQGAHVSRTESDDAKADDFIVRFKQQLQLQRLDPITRYKEKICREEAEIK